MIIDETPEGKLEKPRLDIIERVRFLDTEEYELKWAYRDIIYFNETADPNLIVANFDEEKFLCNSEEKRTVSKDQII
jgi:hypothetical protein